MCPRCVQGRAEGKQGDCPCPRLAGMAAGILGAFLGQGAVRGGHWTGLSSLCLHSPAGESNMGECVGCGGAGRASATCERTTLLGLVGAHWDPGKME